MWLDEDYLVARSVRGHSAPVKNINKLFRRLGTGAFHAAVEVYGSEWSYGGTDEGSGVFRCMPTTCPGHSFRESVSMGEVDLNPDEVFRLVTRMSETWLGTDYDLLRHNCCHFADALCLELGLGHIPPWILNLAGAGASVANGVHKATDKAQAVKMVAAAKAQEIEGKYHLAEKATGVAGECFTRFDDAVCCGGRKKSPRQLAEGAAMRAKQLKGPVSAKAAASGA
eukprot:TRINITY_DN26566_c0_g2_i3.p2 TRINITY_DN26566_c0_g2~~TRINITY_DN26566_c0_g2_i3.p2  ORF type:complete len:226 (-),score=63.81 TRINITY_DN26566_c0_g2_i3:126-803(-)